MKIESLKCEKEFDLVFKQGYGIKGKAGTFLIRKSNGKIRLGIIASKKLGNAVTRNRIKRIFREAIKKIAGNIKEPIEIVVIPGAITAKYSSDEAYDATKKAFDSAGLTQTGKT
jgi:ribonuclease P protein component